MRNWGSGSDFLKISAKWPSWGSCLLSGVKVGLLSTLLLALHLAEDLELKP